MSRSPKRVLDNWEWVGDIDPSPTKGTTAPQLAALKRHQISE